MPRRFTDAEIHVHAERERIVAWVPGGGPAAAQPLAHPFTLAALLAAATAVRATLNADPGLAEVAGSKYAARRVLFVGGSSHGQHLLVYPLRAPDAPDGVSWHQSLAVNGETYNYTRMEYPDGQHRATYMAEDAATVELFEEACRLAGLTTPEPAPPSPGYRDEDIRVTHATGRLILSTTDGRRRINLNAAVEPTLADIRRCIEEAADDPDHTAARAAWVSEASTKLGGFYEYVAPGRLRTWFIWENEHPTEERAQPRAGRHKFGLGLTPQQGVCGHVAPRLRAVDAPDPSQASGPPPHRGIRCTLNPGHAPDHTATAGMISLTWPAAKCGATTTLTLSSSTHPGGTLVSTTDHALTCQETISYMDGQEIPHLGHTARYRDTVWTWTDGHPPRLGGKLLSSAQ